MGDGFSNSTVGGVGNLIRSWIQSVPFVSGITGWRISKNGNAEFNGATFRGGVVVTGNNAVLFYSGTPALGNLVGSISPIGGTDSFGNVYPVGFQFTNGSLTYKASVETYLGTLIPDVRLSTGSPSENTDFHLGSVVQGVGGTTRLIFSEVVGPTNVTNKDVAVVEFWSGNDAGTAQAFGRLSYNSSIIGGGGAFSITPVVWGVNGVGLIMCNAILGLQPGTGTLVTPPAVESWHTLGLNAGFQALAGFQTPRYQFEPINGGRCRLDGIVQLTANLAGGTVIGTLPATLQSNGSPAYRPSTAKAILNATNLSGHTSGVESFQIQTNGNITLGQAGSIGNYLSFDDVCFPVD